MTEETKRRIREVWGQLPGMYHATDAGDDITCAFLATPSDLMDDAGLLSSDLIRSHDAFHPEDGVTPEERRDCLIAMLDAGAFDDLDAA